jgi:CCR4-NOT transcription complex subunit 1
MFLAGHPNHQLVFMRIWQIEPTYLTSAFRDFYEENPLNITRILDVAQDLKVSFYLSLWSIVVRLVEHFCVCDRF